jgi:hypothetical protein
MTADASRAARCASCTSSHRRGAPKSSSGSSVMTRSSRRSCLSSSRLRASALRGQAAAPVRPRQRQLGQPRSGSSRCLMRCRFDDARREGPRMLHEPSRSHQSPMMTTSASQGSTKWTHWELMEVIGMRCVKKNSSCSSIADTCMT